MCKFLKHFCIFSCLIIYSCNQQNNQQQNEKPKEVAKNEKKDVKTEIDEYKKTIPATNRNPENNEWNNNVYRNTFYRFRIEFPKGWEYDNGTTKSTLARAGNREIGAAFSVTVSHLPEKPINPNDITESYPTEKFEKYLNEVLALQNTKAENFKIQKGFLNNFPAYLIEFTHVVSAGDRTYTYLGKQVQCYYDSKIYQVNLNLPLDGYDNEMNKLYHRVIESFNFEIAY